MPQIPAGFRPKIIAYWLGWIPENEQGYPALANLPAYVDVLVLAFALVQRGTLVLGASEVPNPGGGSACPATSLLDPSVPEHTFQNLRTWVQQAKAANSNLEVLLSIGGARYCDWNSITDPHQFAQNVATALALWNLPGQSPLLDGIDLDYEDGTGYCGTLCATPQTIGQVIQEIYQILPENKLLGHRKILSLPLYSGTPSDLLDNVQSLAPYITFASTMDYPPANGCYQSYQHIRGLFDGWLAMGFQVPSGGSQAAHHHRIHHPHNHDANPATRLADPTDSTDPITTCFQAAKSHGVTFDAGMLWHASSAAYSAACLASLESNVDPGGRGTARRGEAEE